MILTNILLMLVSILSIIILYIILNDTKNNEKIASNVRIIRNHLIKNRIEKVMMRKEKKLQNNIEHFYHPKIKKPQKDTPTIKGVIFKINQLLRKQELEVEGASAQYQNTIHEIKNDIKEEIEELLNTKN